MGKKQRKMGKAERQKRREQHAATWTEGFDYGYRMGYDQGTKDSNVNFNKLNQGVLLK